MAFIVEQRKPKAVLPMWKQWAECTGSRSATEEEATEHLRWWYAYDVVYSCQGWEYRIRQVK